MSGSVTGEERPCGPLALQPWTEHAELSPPSLVGSLLPCVTCNRTFLPEALARHQNICQKTAHKKRKVFSSSRQRLQGTGIDPEEVHRSPSPPLRRRSTSRSSWRDKHTQLLNTVRCARGVAPAASAPTVPVDYEQCPFCGRHFGPKAAERHISWCKEQKSRINTSTPSAVAKNRLDARVKYQAPLPLKPRPKRLSVERLSREASPAVSVASSAATATTAVRSPTRQTRDYAREYRERASQEREQRIQERKRSPAAVVSSGYGKQPASFRLIREGSEPRTASPTKDGFRRTQSFRSRPAAARPGLKHQRTTGSLSVRSSVTTQQQQQRQQHHHQQHQQQQERRDEPDGGEDVPADRHIYQRSTSTPTESTSAHHGSTLSPSRPSQPFSAAGPQRSPSPPPPPPPPPPCDEAYITRSQLDEFHRISDAVKQPQTEPETEPEPEPEPAGSCQSSPASGRPASLDDLDASLTSERTSDGEGADTYRVTSGQVRRRLQQRGARRSGRSLGAQIELTVTPLRPPPPAPPPPGVGPGSSPTAGKQLSAEEAREQVPAAAAAVVAGTRGAGRRVPLPSNESVAVRQEAVREAREAREARTPEEVFADSLEDLITVTECPVLVKPKAASCRGARPRGVTPAVGCVSLPALPQPPTPRPRPRPRPRRAGRLTLPPLEVRSGPPTGRHAQPQPQDGYDPYASAERQLEELLGHTASPSPPAKTNRSPSPLKANRSPSPHSKAHRSPSPVKAPRSPSPPKPTVSRGLQRGPTSPPTSVSAPVPARSPSPGRSAFAKIERPHSALFPLGEGVVRPTALQPRKDPIAEAISILNEYAIQQQTAADEGPPSPPSSVESSQTVINKYEFVSNAIAAYRESAESMPPPPEPEADEPCTPTNASFPTNHGSRRPSGAPGDTAVEPPPPADGANPSPPPPPPQHGWSEPPWRPIDESNRSSNRSSSERNGGYSQQLQFPGLPLGGDERAMSPSDSLYETEMPDFDLIMEQARRASERKNSALSPRKARRRGLDMREMMGLEVADLNMKNGGSGSSTPPRFCHECGSQYPVQAAKFCCQCGAQKLCI